MSGSLHSKKRTSGSEPSSAGAKDRIHRPANNNPAVMSRRPRTTRTTTGLPVPMGNRLDAILDTIQPIEMPPDPDREVEVTCECCPERGEDFDEHLLIDDYFDAAADFLGQDWLNAHVETFRDSPSPKTAPRPVKNYRRARKELGYVEDEFESHFLETSIPVLEFLNLGRYVLLLRESRADIIHPASFDVRSCEAHCW